VLVVNNDLPVRSLPQFIDHARANPGRLNYGSPSPGSQANLAFMLFQKQVGISLQHVAYRGASQAMNDLIGGHIAVTSTALTSAAGTILGGKVRPLAVTARKRVPDFAAIPTFAEQGYSDLVAEVWFSLSGPRGLPTDIVRALNEEVRKALQAPDVRARLERDAIDPELLDPAAFLAFFKSENAKWGTLAKEVMGAAK
jgi:tripartite-type tricarboxylate transporter receptor subunit TctC